ncbi:MAG: ABC transporter ATP-binding protein [Planctomycetes bacterium DG_20]|nr:MAG: ABC transporter ATP-binding protein [Planctomycetes bacterium DG_20]
MSEPLLDVRDLRTYFRTSAEPLRAVDGVSFTVGRGETVGLVGESGCGKSLTGLSIMQLVPRPTGYIAGGTIHFGGRDVLAMTGPERRALRGGKVAMIFQEPMTSLNPVLSVRTQLLEAIRRHLRLSRPEALRRGVEALRLVRMPDPVARLREYPHQLSGGMQQRVMIAMALACHPALLIADEPTTALDATVQARILDLLRDLQATLGMAILFITHDLAVVAEMAHRVAVMYAGKIAETAPADALFGPEGPRHPYTQLLLRCRPSRAKRRRRLESIRGRVPSPSDYPPGCRFCDRCPHAFEPCRATEPALVQIGADHRVACHLYDRRFRPAASVGAAAAEQARPGGPPADGLLLEAREVAKYFPVRKGILQRVVGHVKAVDGVDLAIRRGTTVALVGESGCGKTTLGKTLMRLLPATAGTVRFDGADVTAFGEHDLRRFRRRAQIVFQDPFSSLNPRMMVREIIEEGMRVHGIGSAAAERHARVRELLDRVGLPAGAATSYPHEFSGGQRQRIGIARVLAVEPDFVVCDEPTSALDVSIQAQILNLLSHLQDQFHLTYLFITHDLGVVECVADEVAVMYLGRIVEHRATELLFDEPRHPYTQALLSAIPVADASRRREPIRLEGDVPSPSAPPPGCHFHPRCRHAMDVCKNQYPPIVRLEDGGTVRCHLCRNDPAPTVDEGS